MHTSSRGAIGSLQMDTATRRRLATASKEFKCPTCDRTNADIMQQSATEAAASETESVSAPVVEIPEGLDLAFRDELDNGGGGNSGNSGDNGDNGDNSAADDAMRSTEVLPGTRERDEETVSRMTERIIRRELRERQTVFGRAAEAADNQHVIHNQQPTLANAGTPVETVATAIANTNADTNANANTIYTRTQTPANPCTTLPRAMSMDSETAELAEGFVTTGPAAVHHVVPDVVMQVRAEMAVTRPSDGWINAALAVAIVAALIVVLKIAVVMAINVYRLRFA